MIPSLPEQASIVLFLDDAIDTIDSSIFRTLTQIELMNEIRTRLIADVVTGKLDVREAVTALPETAPFTPENDLKDAQRITNSFAINNAEASG